MVLPILSMLSSFAVANSIPSALFMSVKPFILFSLSLSLSLSLWTLLRYVYSRLKWLGNRGLSLAITMLFLALWHGLWPGYYISFLYEMMYIMVERMVGWIVIGGDL